MSETFTPVDFVMQYGSRCRDCADNFGVCPGDGLPCADRRKAIQGVVDALEYGRRHGYVMDALPDGWMLRHTAEAYGEGCSPGKWSFQETEPNIAASDAWRWEVKPVFALSPDTGSREG